MPDKSPPVFAPNSIQKYNKYLKNTPEDPRLDKLVKWLRSNGLKGQILRALLRRIDTPNGLHNHEDLEPMLLLSLARQRIAREARLERYP